MAKRIRVNGTVASVTDSMALVKPNADAPISTTAMMIDAGTQYNGMPLDSFLTVGLELSGDWDPTAMRFFPSLANWSESRFLDNFPVGTIVLGLVAAVSRQTAMFASIRHCRSK